MSVGFSRLGFIPPLPLASVRFERSQRSKREKNRVAARGRATGLSSAPCSRMSILQFANGPKISMGHLLGAEKCSFLVRDIDGPTMAAAPVESCQFVVLRSLGGRFGSVHRYAIAATVASGGGGASRPSGPRRERRIELVGSPRVRFRNKQLRVILHYYDLVLSKLATGRGRRASSNDNS